MSDKPLTYKDAMKLLSSQDSKIVGAIDKLFGGVILAAGIFAGPGALTLLGPKNELVKLSNEAVAKLSGRAKRAIGIERAALVANLYNRGGLNAIQGSAVGKRRRTIHPDGHRERS
jgi:hypothetical protein